MAGDGQVAQVCISETVQVDVAVVGGGTGGRVAAVSAARAGAKTLLIEMSHQLGGMTTAGMVIGMGGMRTYKRKDWPSMSTRTDGAQTIGGMAAEFADRLKSEGGAWGTPGIHTGQLVQDDELARYTIEQMVQESGAEVWYGAQLLDVVIEHACVRGILVASKQGVRQVRCATCIDATGDGDVAAKAGARWETGRPTDQKPQPATMYFILGGHDIQKTLSFARLHPNEVGTGGREVPFPDIGMEEIVRRIAAGEPWRFPGGFYSLREQALALGDFPTPHGSASPHQVVSGWRSTFAGGATRNDRVAFNIDGAFEVDFTDTRQTTLAMMGMRKYVVALARFYRRYIPGFETSYLDKTAVLPGIRESRRITGEYVMTRDEVIASASFDDVIARTGQHLDAHAEVIGESQSARGNPGQWMEDLQGRGWVEIPYRCLIPKGVDGVLIVGRPVSADHWAHGSLRWQFPTMAMAESAGLAAAMAARAGRSVRDIDVPALQDALRARGALL